MLALVVWYHYHGVVLDGDNPYLCRRLSSSVLGLSAPPDGLELLPVLPRLLLLRLGPALPEAQPSSSSSVEQSSSSSSEPESLSSLLLPSLPAADCGEALVDVVLQIAEDLMRFLALDAGKLASRASKAVAVSCSTSSGVRAALLWAPARWLRDRCTV